MKKMGLIVAVICTVCLIVPLIGSGAPVGATRRGLRLTPDEAIAAARGNAQKPGTSFTILREIVANANTRRVGDQALEQARAHQIKLYGNRTLPDLLRSGGFLIAEYDPKTTNVVAEHVVSLGLDGVPKDAFYPCEGVVKLDDAEELVRETTEFAKLLYSTRPSEALSLESKYYGGTFPECGNGQSEEGCGLFGIPRSLLKLGLGQNQYREVAALTGGVSIWQFRYAVSMPAFAASPLVATQATEGPLAEFLRNNHMDPDFDFDLENIQSKKQLRERIEVLRRMGKFLEEALRSNETDPALVKANISVAVLPLGIGADSPNDSTRYNTATASGILIEWQRLPKGGFAVKLISQGG